MNPNLETFNTWNNLASLYQEKFMDLDLYNETYDLICNSIEKPRAKLLEIGCGPGNITKYLLNKRPDFQIMGIDVAPNMVELAKQNNPTASFEVMDSRQISNLNMQLDGIIAGFCIPYLSNIETNQLIEDAYKLLNENGLIYISFVEGNPDASEFKDSGFGRVYFYYHLLNDIVTQLKLNQFSNIKSYHVNYKRAESKVEVHTILIARK